MTSRPWRVWVLHDSWHWYVVPGMAYTTEARAVAAARREYPEATGVFSMPVGVGHIAGAVRRLSSYPAA